MAWVSSARKRSPWLLHYETGGCNGCAIEFVAALTPLYDLERFGMLNTGNPKHADILVVTGCVNARSGRVLRNLYEQMSEPKVVVAVGVCACTGGIFHDGYNLAPGADKVVPVDLYLPNCAARPEAIIDALLTAADLLAETRRRDQHAHQRAPDQQG
ncbi:MAG: NADH-quinone oxidoreductase subunit NuoB [Firmicutes bacterium]|nr:NADH-quinone oxidoreductase subunit NuoB [Bacillota bacterium]